MKAVNIGGQAVLEGIMMKYEHTYAVAVRREDGSIGVEKKEFYGMVQKYSGVGKLPFFRGIFQFIDSMVLGMKTLEISSALYEGEVAKGKDKTSVWQSLTMGVSFFLGIALFMVVPYLLAHVFQKMGFSYEVRTVIEGLIRIGIFVSYLLAISRLSEIRRTFMYHGAEHKCINCLEEGLPLTVENVKKSSKAHKRCGTSFFVFVFLIGLALFLLVPIQGFLPRLLLRIGLVPFLAGFSYEILRLAGRSKHSFLEFLSFPGLQFQKLTTKEPDEKMIEVAIEAVEQVFDWRSYESETYTKGSI